MNIEKMKMAWKRAWVGVGLMGAIAAAAAMPMLTGGSVTGAPGSKIQMPVQFTAGASGVASLQFTVNLPKGWTLLSVTPGDIVNAAAKSVKANLKNGTVIVFGMNQKPLDSGVAVNLSLQAPKSITAGKYPVTLQNVVLSDPKGTRVPAGSSLEGAVTVQ